MNVPTIKQVNEAELRWIESQLVAARNFVARYAPLHTNGDLNLIALEAAWDAWMATLPSDTQDINHAINCVGVPFGSLLVQTGEFVWCIASDEWGTDLAVHALPGRGDVLVYPADFVSKRWESRTTHFLKEAFAEIVEHVSDTRQQWDEAKPLA